MHTNEAKEAFHFSEESCSEAAPKSHVWENVPNNGVVYYHKTSFMIIAYTSLTVNLAPKIN